MKIEGFRQKKLEMAKEETIKENKRKGAESENRF